MSQRLGEGGSDHRTRAYLARGGKGTDSLKRAGAVGDSDLGAPPTPARAVLDRRGEGFVQRLLCEFEMPSRRMSVPRTRRDSAR